MKTLHLDPAAGDQAALVTEEIDRLLREGKRIAVTVAEEQELLSPQQASGRLGSLAGMSLSLWPAGVPKERLVANCCSMVVPAGASRLRPEHSGGGVALTDRLYVCPAPNVHAEISPQTHSNLSSHYRRRAARDSRAGPPDRGMSRHVIGLAPVWAINRPRNDRLPVSMGHRAGLR
jgi:hypothetical protein